MFYYRKKYKKYLDIVIHICYYISVKRKNYKNQNQQKYKKLLDKRNQIWYYITIERNKRFTKWR